MEIGSAAFRNGYDSRRNGAHFGITMAIDDTDTVGPTEHSFWSDTAYTSNFIRPLLENFAKISGTWTLTST